MKKLFLVTLASGMLLVGCNSKNANMNGIDPNNMDTSIQPGIDFYQYACGGWIKNNPLTDEYARFGQFDKLVESNREQVKSLIEDLGKSKHAQGSIEQKIGTLYNIGMDSIKLNSDGFQPVEPELKALSNIKSNADVKTALPEMNLKSLFPFFGTFASSDFTNSAMQIAWIYQSGLNMGEREYYLDETEKGKEFIAKYKLLITNLFKRANAAALIGVNQTPEQMAEAVVALETKLAKAQMDKHTSRDPHKIFNKMSVADLQKKAPGLDFNAYFTAMGLTLDSLNVGQPDYIKFTTNLINTYNVDDIKAYLAWNIINDAAKYLDDETQMERFNFYGKTLSGKKEMFPRWKRCVSTVNASLGEAVGEMYAKKYFPPQAKERMLTLVENLRIALGQRIDSLEWMSPATKQNAHKKLETFRVKVGYPDKWKDYSALEIKDDNYYTNMLRVRKFDIAYDLNKINKPTDVEEWGLTPQDVNAYYNPTTNEICFPAGILQPPFFYLHADDAVNYGAIGVVIGHEMTHGFDDQGCKYDHFGNLVNWWTDEDNNAFVNRTGVLVDHFNKIEVLPGTFADGKYTLGENIADNGGIQVAFLAMENSMKDKKVKEINGQTPEQRFFIAYAQLWAQNIRDEEIIRLTKEDVHSLGKWRVNGTLPHIQQWYDAFGIKPTDPLYLAPEKRAQIW